MRDDDERLFELITQVEKQFVQFDFIFRIETSRRLIGKYDRGAVYQCSGDGNPLFFTARQLSRFVSQSVAQAQEIEYPLGLLFCIRLVFSPDESRNHHIFESRKFGQQLVELEYESDVTVSETRHFPIGEVIHPSAVV